MKDFSIESLLQESLYPRMSALDRRVSFSPLLPGFYPSMWAAEFPTFPKLLTPAHHQHPHVGAPQQTRPPRVFPAPLDASRPLDLAAKRGIVKEEVKEEIPLSLLHGDFLKEFVSSGLGGGGAANAGSLQSEARALGPIKDEADFRSYLSFLSSASHLGALFPPWQLEEERKMKPKASQQCPICNKVIQGAGKLPRHMRTHTGEKPYMCTICEVRFTRYVESVVVLTGRTDILFRSSCVLTSKHRVVKLSGVNGEVARALLTEVNVFSPNLNIKELKVESPFRWFLRVRDVTHQHPPALPYFPPLNVVS